MKLAILGMKSVSTDWLEREAKLVFGERNVKRFDLRHAKMEVTSRMDVLVNGSALSEFDAVLLRGSYKYTDFLQSAAYILSQRGVYIGAKPYFYKVAHNKFLTAIFLSKAGVPVVNTYRTLKVQAAKELLNELKYPIILKMPAGTHGKGVVLAESKAAASSILDTMETLAQPILIQDYIETGGRDVRAIVAGDEVIASYMRVASRGEKRANIHAGGEGREHELSKKERQVAIAAARAVGADYCAVDMIKTTKGPAVLEVNVSAGLQGVTKVTKKNVARQLIKYIYEQTKRRKEQASKRTYKKIMAGIGVAKAHESIGAAPVYVLEAKFAGDSLVIPEAAASYLGAKHGDELNFRVQKGKIVIENPKK